MTAAKDMTPEEPIDSFSKNMTRGRQISHNADESGRTLGKVAGGWWGIMRPEMSRFTIRIWSTGHAKMKMNRVGLV